MAHLDAASGAPLAWADLTPATLARAKAERRFVVLDGAAEWCHFCHVMEAVTYHDPRVARILRERFIAVKVDVDSRPDIEERYGAWGWPATILFSPDAVELGKYRGYIAPDDFVEILQAVVASGDKRPDGAVSEAGEPREAALPAPLDGAALAWATRFAELELEEYWDPKEGGWGIEPKVPLGADIAWALGRGAAPGGATQRAHALVALDRQRAIIDPVWGGIYQYSVAPDWNHPHFEKLITWNAGALEAYARAFAATHDAKQLEGARSIRRYLEAFALSPGGAFYGSQDADLNAHERGKRFVDGGAYYALDDAHRRALGVPRIDTHEYARDSGLGIAAYVALYEATGDRAALDVARRAAARILATHATPRGAVTHDARTETSGQPGDPEVLHLADNAAFGFGLARLAEATKDAATLEAAKRIGDLLVKDLAAPDGGFYAHTEDPNAVGVFQSRRRPVDDNIAAARFLLRLHRVTGDARWLAAAERSIARLATPETIKGRAKFLGDLLLAFDELAAARAAAARR